MNARAPWLALLLACSGPKADDPHQDDTGADTDSAAESGGDSESGESGTDSGESGTDSGTDSGETGDTGGETAETGPCEQAWYRDADGDGYGDPADTVTDCVAPAGYVADGTDCADGDPAVHPDAVEQCDLDDDNCDGRADIGETSRWYTDDDGDGWGHPAQYEDTCDPEPGWVLVGSDCRPADVEAYPGASERCNDDDDDCDGEVDEDFERDADGYTSVECGGDDCDDDDPAVFPGAVEVCEDGVDNDCDGGDDHCGYAGDEPLGDADAKVYSSAPNNDAGRLIEFGDLDGDGEDEAVVATLYASSYAGGAYVVDDPSGTATLDAAGFQLQSDASTAYAGRSVGVADINGDGYEDVGLGAPDSTCKVYINFGPIAADLTLASSDIILYGGANTETGHGHDLADVTGDGVADAVIGAYEDTIGTPYSGIVYIVEGPISTGTSSLPNAADTRLIGEMSSAYAGRFVRAGGDVDGDGVGDILIAAPYQNTRGSYAGAGYIVYGGVTGDVSLSSADGKFIGERANDYLGETLALGDLNGDGLDDVVLGSYHGPSNAYEGTAYVIFGPASGEIDVAAADATVQGTDRMAYASSGVAARDIDGDAIAELLVGSGGDATVGTDAGAAWLYFGPVSGALGATDADAIFYGESAGDGAGWGVGIGDLDGNGIGDVGIGAPTESSGGSAGGAAYFFLPTG